MSSQHQFLFSPGEWIGQGKITFSHSSAHLRFYMKWKINPIQQGIIRAEQLIEQEGSAVLLSNTLHFTPVNDASFNVTLSSELTGEVPGKGLVEPRSVAWEYTKQDGLEREEQFEGFEVYELQDNGDYMLHAEYFSGASFRTIIDGRIWRKA